ncbi:Uncharacterized protein XB16_0047 [Leptospira santarosai]|uniref:Uncharacterized protein n=1 Tax=Leptospira santarosai TaxID=28183 RepID=A0A2P1QNE9_9LEPT|nr:Uncharacterized protein XB16_0047 [Leptospira santarosai]
MNFALETLQQTAVLCRDFFKIVILGFYKGTLKKFLRGDSNPLGI